MSEPAAPPKQPVDRHYSAGLIALIVVGCILLLPGICALVFAVGSMPTWNARDPFLGLVVGIWLICFAISAIGIVLIVVARRRAVLKP